MSKQLGVDGKGRLLTPWRRSLNFLHMMGSALMPPKIPDRSKELEARSDEAFQKLLKAEVELAELKTKKQLRARIEELEEENRILKINLRVAMRDHC